MKKSFTFFAISALFLMLLFPVSVKAEDREINFGWAEKDNNGVPVPRDNCFAYTVSVGGSIKGADNDAWPSFAGGVTATSHNTYTLTAGTHDFTLRVKVDGDTKNNFQLPIVKIGDTEKSITNQTLDNGKIYDLTYSITISAGTYTIQVITVDGDNDRFKMTYLKIPASAFAPTYAVTVNSGANGSASAGKASYAAGEKVTLTATPSDGYMLDEWTTNDAITFANSKREITTFTMPSSPVTVQASFKTDTRCDYSQTIQCEIYDEQSGYADLFTSDLKPSSTSCWHDGNDDGKMIEVGTGGKEIFFYVTLPINAVYTFSPYVFDVASNDRLIYFNIYSLDGAESGSVQYGGSTYTKKFGGQNVSAPLDHSNWNNYGCYQTSVHELNAGTYILGLYGTNQVRYDKIVISAKDDAFCGNAITMTKTEGGSANPTSSVASASPGETVTVTAAAASAGYNFSGWTASPSSVEFANAKAPTTTFVMPAEDVTITANYEASVSSTFTYTTSGSGSITCDTPSDSDVPSGTVIEMTAVPSTDYVFLGWSAPAGTFSNRYALTTTFTMPAEDAEVTATFAQVNNVISQGSEIGSDKGNSGGDASIAESHIADFDAFGHNVVKLTYSNMSGSSAYCGWNIGKSDSYNSASSAGATGFGFYYKTEAADDAVAMWLDPNTGNDADQRGMQLEATENVWKYVYIEHAVANSWNRDNIIIYINGAKDSKTTANASGAIYIADIAATSITSKPDIKYYHYTNNRSGAMHVNDYGTLCLPMGGTIEGATLYSVAGKETGDINYLVLEDQGTTVVAGKPYITQSTDISYTVTMNGPHIAVQNGNGLVGTYETIDLAPYAEPSTLNYVLNQNAFKKAGSGVTVGAYRAYLDWGAEITAPAPAQSARRIRMVIEGKEVQTGMETVTAMPKTTKVLIDGQLFIIREGKRYTLTGARAQ